MDGEDREKGIAALDTHLRQTEDHPVLLRVNTVVGGMPKAFRGQIHRVMDGDGSLKTVEAELEQLSQGRYLSPRKIDQLLRSLPGVKVSLPETEIRRLESLLPHELSPEMIRKLELFREKTEGNLPPYIQQIPATLTVDGVETNFTLANFEQIWERMEEVWDPDRIENDRDVALHDDEMMSSVVARIPTRTRANTLGMYLTDSVTEKMRNKVWGDGRLRAYSAGCLEGSRMMNYPHQLEYQQKTLGKDSQVGIDAFFTLLFRNLAIVRREGLMMNGSSRRQDKKGDTWMRVNDMTSVGPYIIASDDGSLFIEDYPPYGAGGHGIGACVEIS